MFNRYPYTDAHQLNLDWVIKQVKKIPTKLSQLINDSGFVNSTQAAAVAPVQSVNGQTGDVIVTGTGAVDSVNGQTGAVVLTAADVGAKPASYSAPVDSVNGQTGAVVLDAAAVGAKPANYAAPVDSVNGQTGAVVLDAADVGAKPANYSAPVDSVNGQTGAVVLTASDVGALPSSTTIPTKTSDLNNDSGFVNASGAAAAAPVQSVNGQTGAVVLPSLDEGSNYIKFPDGTLIVFMRHTLTTKIATSAGGGYVSDTLALPNYPVTFVNTPARSFGVDAPDYGSVICQQNSYGGGAPSTTNPGSVSLFRPYANPNNTNYTVSVVAIGKWS